MIYVTIMFTGFQVDVRDRYAMKWTIYYIRYRQKKQYTQGRN